MFKNFLALSLFSFLLHACGQPQSAIRKESAAQTPNTPAMSFHSLQATTLSGQPFDFATLKGKKVVVLNVASKCGYTKQYADWEAYFKKHSDKVVVLGFPSNQFMNQEPGSAEDIAAFCQKNYGVSFPMFDKVQVKGNDKHAVYQWLTDPAKNGWNDQEPGWNFSKYVVDENGTLVAFFPSAVLPTDAEFVKSIGL
jgi:glutathione peroxidase